MEITMDNKTPNDEILYKKAQKRVKEISNFYWFVGGYIIVAVVLLYRDYSKNIFNFKSEYIVFMLILQGVFLLGYGIYLFVPALHNWEERKIKELMEKYRNNGRQH